MGNKNSNTGGGTVTREKPQPGCYAKGGDSYCRSISEAVRCENLDNGDFICLCSPFFDSTGINTSSKCVKSQYHPDNMKGGAFLQSPTIGADEARQSTTGGDGKFGNEWVWGLGGFGVAVFLFFLGFFVRWMVKGRKRGNKGEQQALIGESTYSGVTPATPINNGGSVRSGGVAV